MFVAQQYTSRVANAVLDELFAEKRIISADQLSDVVIEVDKTYRDLTGEDLLLEKPIEVQCFAGEDAKLRLLSIIDFFGGPEDRAKVFMRAPHAKALMVDYSDSGDPIVGQAIYLALTDIRWGV